MRLRSVIYIYIVLLALVGTFIVMSAKFSLSKASDIQYIWQNFEKLQSEKSISLHALHAELGFGGMIHNFKNYLLRQN